MKPITSAASTFLNALRAFSAQLVLVGHAILILGIAPALGEPNAPYLQELGVVVFFVLSGFVITHTTRLKANSASREYGFATYTGDRVARIYSVYGPAMLLVFLLTLLFNVMSGNAIFKALGFDQFLGNLLMLQSHPLFKTGKISNLIGDPLPHVSAYGLGRPFWSIAVEWWFYLTFGVIYFAIKSWPILSPWKKGAFIFGISLSLLVPVHQALGQHLALVFAWGFGSLMSFALNWFTNIAKRFPLHLSWVGGAISLLSPVPLYLRHHGAYSLTFVVLLSAGLIITLAGLQNLESSKLSRISAFFADYSYSLYAIHYPIVILVALLKWNPILLLLLAVGLANLSSWLFFLAFERHHRSFRRIMKSRFF